MARSTAERQAAYRAQRRLAGKDGDSRINTWVSANAARALDRLSQHLDLTKRETLERLLTEEENRVLASALPNHFDNDGQGGSLYVAS